MGIFRSTRLLALTALLWSGSAFSDGTISDGAFSFNYRTADGGADLVGLSTGDALFQIRWYFRLSGGTQETLLSAPDTETYVGNLATLTWNAVGTQGSQFSVVVTFELNDLGVDALSLDANAEVTGIDPVDVTMFYYYDVDLGGTFSNDSAALVSSPNAVRVTDPNTPGEFTVTAAGNDSFQVATFASIRNLLDDAGITNLDNSGLPFGPGDFTGAFQWAEVSLGQGQSSQFGVVSQADPQASPPPVPPAPSIPVPVDHPLALLALLLLAGGLGARALRVN